jgi:hypothetical protein
MDGKDHNDRSDRVEIFSKAVRAGKRTYFFDVKATKDGELYLTVTESKRRFSQQEGKFFYERHKLFLYGEDFDKFRRGLDDTIRFIHTGERPLPDEDDDFDETTDIDLPIDPILKSEYSDLKSEFTDLNFDDLTDSDPKL